MTTIKIPVFFLILFFLLINRIFASCADRDYGVYIDTISPGVVDRYLYRYGPNRLPTFYPDTTELIKWKSTHINATPANFQQRITESDLQNSLKQKIDSSKTVMLASIDSVANTLSDNSDSIFSVYWRPIKTFKGQNKWDSYTISDNHSSVPFYKKNGLKKVIGEQVLLFFNEHPTSFKKFPVAEQDGPCGFGSSTFLVRNGRIVRTGFYWLGLPGISLDFSDVMDKLVSTDFMAVKKSNLIIWQQYRELHIYLPVNKETETKVTIYNSKGITIESFYLLPGVTRVWIPQKNTPGIYHFGILVEGELILQKIIYL